MPWKRDELEALVEANQSENIQAIRALVDQNPDLLNAPIEEFVFWTIVDVCTTKLTEPEWVEALNHFLDSYGSQIELNPEREDSNYAAFRIILSSSSPRNVTLGLFHKFLRIKPDIIRLPDSRFGCTALHHAVEGKNIDIIRYLVEEALIDPCAMNRVDKNPLIHFITYFGSSERDFSEDDEAVMEYLFPLTFTPDYIDRIPFNSALEIYEDVIVSRSERMFERFTESIYGPAVNSRHWLIRRFLDVFDIDVLDVKARDQQYYGRGRLICLFLHDRIESLTMRSAAMEMMADMLYVVGKETFGNPGRMKCFFQLLDAAPKRLTRLQKFPPFTVVADPYFYHIQFPLLYVPPEAHQTREVARQMHEILEELHGEAPAKLEEVVRRIFEYAEKSGKNPFEENNGFIDLRSFSLLYSFSARPERQMVKLKGPRKEDFAYTSSLDVYLPFMPKKLLVSDEGRAVPLVLRLKDLCRIEIRAALEARADDDFGKLKRLIEGLPLPDPVKNYLRYLENVL